MRGKKKTQESTLTNKGCGRDREFSERDEDKMLRSERFIARKPCDERSFSLRNSLGITGARGLAQRGGRQNVGVEILHPRKARVQDDRLV